jgi:glycosyltransferase involved in cell wall biosynthesis
MFGPLASSLDALGLAQPNIFYCGVLEDISVADFSGHDGFLFTSLFEGMPNVVLEMSQHAIPLVLAKVGGLPGTFDEKAVFFVEPTNEDDAVTAFSRALDKAIAMVVAARNEVLKRHSPAAFASNVANLFGRP